MVSIENIVSRLIILGKGDYSDSEVEKISTMANKVYDWFIYLECIEYRIEGGTEDTDQLEEQYKELEEGVVELQLDLIEAATPGHIRFTLEEIDFRYKALQVVKEIKEIVPRE